MQVVGIIIFVVLAIFVTWLLIDTIIHCVKRVKEKKARKNKEVKDVVDNETTNQ